MKKIITRKNFIQKSVFAGAGFLFFNPLLSAKKDTEIVMTVNGLMPSAEMGFTLTHEHVLVDFIGAEKYSKSRYDADEVYNTALPFLLDVKNKGCKTFVDCSPAYLGRDVKIFERLARATGLNIITNTGYYGAAGEKFLPPHAFTETAQQLANRWIDEWKNGIEGTGIKPGFMKIAVDTAPLTPTQRKLIEAAAITHLATGLLIAVHTGDAKAHIEQLSILKAYNVSPSAKIWVHAQGADKTDHIEAAKIKSWVSFDGVNPDNIDTYLALLQNMKDNKLLDYVLVSQDSGWYNVGDPKGGLYKSYTCIFTRLIPALKKNGFTEAEIDQIFRVNPKRAFTIKVRKPGNR